MCDGTHRVCHIYPSSVFLVINRQPMILKTTRCIAVAYEVRDSISPASLHLTHLHFPSPHFHQTSRHVTSLHLTAPHLTSVTKCIFTDTLAVLIYRRNLFMNIEACNLLFSELNRKFSNNEKKIETVEMNIFFSV